MNEPTVPVHQLLAAALWVIAGGFLLAGWLVYFADLADLAILLITSAGPLALVAATTTARIWACRVARLVRAGEGPAGGGETPLRTVRG